MKKNYLFVLAMIVIAVCGFTSCGSDDDENEENGGGTVDITGKAELFINDVKVEILTEGSKLLAYDRYGGGAMGLSSSITFKDSNGKEGSIRINFEDFEDGNKGVFEGVKVGDELTKIAPIFWYELQYKSNIYGNNQGRSEQMNNAGSVKIVQLNKSQKAIRIDIKDMKVVLENSNNFPVANGEQIKISGYIEGSVARQGLK